LEMSERKLRKI